MLIPLMSPPAKKRNTTATAKKKPTTLTSLPYDLLLNCLARVSRLYYPILSLVSKSFRSLLASPELYKTRSLLGHTESCLYVCFLWCYTESIWFTLCRKPGKKKGYVLARVPIPHSPPPYFRSLVAVGYSIYNIDIFDPTIVTVLDCRSHTLRQAPSMRVELMSFSASVLDQKIYVAGYIKDEDSGSCKNSIEVFDTKTQSWDLEPIPCSQTYDDLYNKTACIDGKLQVVHSRHEGVVAYSSKEGRWDMVQHMGMSASMKSNSYCEIENVLYYAYDGTIRWYDTEVSKWRKLKGLVGLPMIPIGAFVRLADYGGKMVVLWIGISMTILCAEIALEKRKSGEIWGEVEWFDHVLAFPSYGNLVKALVVTL